MYSQEIKQMVLKRIKNGEKVKSINANTGISIATIYRWVKEEKLESNNIATPFDELSDVELLQKYCNINDLDNALNICLDPKNKNNPIIQSQHVKILIMKSGLYDALAICEQPLFLTDSVIQSQRISILVMQNRICEALAICENPIFEKNDSIQTQHIKILIKKGKIDEALKMCERLEFADYPLIQSIRIKILMLKDRLMEALAISERPLFLTDDVIQSQRICILDKQSRIVKALELCENPIFEKKYNVQSQHIKILIELGRIEDALKICERSEFVNNPRIQSQRIEILINKGNYKMALMICENPLLSEDIVIKRQKGKIIALMQSPFYISSAENLTLKPMDIKISLSLLEAIKKDEILSPSEIDNCEIHDIVKIILIVALYDKQNMSLNVVLRFLKQKMEKYKSISQYLRIIQQLLLRMKSKRIIFDSEYYKTLLNSLLRGKIDEKSLRRCKPN